MSYWKVIGTSCKTKNRQCSQACIQPEKCPGQTHGASPVSHVIIFPFPALVFLLTPCLQQHNQFFLDSEYSSGSALQPGGAVPC